MRIFEAKNYREFVLARVKSLPGRGHGEFRKIARQLKMHTTAVSQVFKGRKELTLEQAQGLAEYLGLGSLETDCLMLLVQRERAGTRALQEYFQAQLTRVRAQASDLVNRLPKDTSLKEEDKATFYSYWYYSGIRVLTSIPGFNSVDAIASRLQLPRSLVARVVEFLLETGLCVEKDGKLEVGPKATHLEAASPLVGRHHANWRLKSIEGLPQRTASELSYSGLMSLSVSDAQAIRARLIDDIERHVATARDSSCESLFCMTLDWFEV